VDNHIITGDPVDWCGDTVLIASLEGVNDAEDLSSVTASGSGVGQDQSDSLLRIDDEDRSDGESNALGVDIGSVLEVEHVIEIRNLTLLVTNDWEAQLAASNLINVFDPSSVRVDGVCRKTDQLDPTLGELRLELGKGAEFSGANRSIILRMGEENNPFVADKLVEVNWTLSRLGLEVGGNGAKTKSRVAFTLVTGT